MRGRRAAGVLVRRGRGVWPGGGSPPGPSYSFVTKRVPEKSRCFEPADHDQGGQPPWTPKEVEKTGFHHKNHNRTVFETKSGFFRFNPRPPWQAGQ